MRAQAQRDAVGLLVRARRDVTRPYAGAYRSTFRGHGLVFDELRDYVAGDDAQQIEWKASARLARPIVKQMREEREGVVALVVDVSDSGAPGFGGRARRDAILRAAAALACAATRAGDPVALVEVGRPTLEISAPRSGPAQLTRILAALEGEVGGGQSDLAPALHWAVDRLPRHSILVLLSDGHCPDPGPILARCARLHEVIALWVDDPIDARGGSAAPARVCSAEGATRGLWRGRDSRAERLSQHRLRARGAEVGTLHTSRPIQDLRRFFRRRQERRA